MDDISRIDFGDRDLLGFYLVHVGPGSKTAQGRNFSDCGKPFSLVGRGDHQTFGDCDQALAVADGGTLFQVLCPDRVIGELQVDAFLHQKLIIQARYRHRFVGKFVPVLRGKSVEHITSVADVSAAVTL